MLSALTERDAAYIQELVEENRKLRQRVQQLATFQQLAYTDPLTSLGNRRRFDSCLANEWCRWQRYGAAFSVVVIDMDGFKQINDTRGHKFGDLALLAMTEHLLRSTREVDEVCRLGGDEFVVILPHTDLEGARAVAERITSGMPTVSSDEAPHDACRLRASVGLAVVRTDMRSANELLEEADGAMYTSKRGSELVAVAPRSWSNTQVQMHSA